MSNVKIDFSSNADQLIKNLKDLQKNLDNVGKSGANSADTLISNMKNLGQQITQVQKDIAGTSKQAVVANDSTKKSTDELKYKLAETTSEVKSQGTAFEFLKGKLKSVAGDIVALGSAYLGFRALTGLRDNVVDFNRAITEIQTIAKVSAPALETIRNQILQVSQATGQQASSVARTFYQIQSAGITDTAKAMNILQNSTKLAVGGLANVETTVNAVTKSISVYGGEITDSAQVTDVLFKAVELGQTRLEELAGTLPNVLGLAKTLGLTFAEVTGAVSAFSNRAGSTSEAVTQLRSVFAGVIDGQERAKQILGDNAGLFTTQALKAKGLAVFLRDLSTATGGSSEKIKELFGRIEAVSGVLGGASDNFQQLDDIIKQVTATSGAGDEAFKTVTKSIGQQITILTNTIKNIPLITIGVSGEDLLASAIGGINNLLSGLLANFNTFKNLVLSTLTTIAIAGFFKFFTEIKAGFIQLGTQLSIFRSQVAIAMNGATVSVRAFALGLKALATTVTALKATLTFGLTIALDFLIFKFLEIKDALGGFSGVADLFGAYFELGVEKARQALINLEISVLQTRDKIASFFNDSALFKKLGLQFELSGTEKIAELNAQLSQSREISSLASAEIDTMLAKVAEGATETKTAIDGAFGTRPSLIPEGTTENTLSDLKSTQEQIALLKEENRLIEKERAQLYADEDFAFLQERLGTEQALRDIAHKQALSNLGQAKKAELDIEKKKLEESKKIAIQEVRFSELSNKEKLEQTANTLQLALALTQAAGKKFFAIGKAVALSESIVSGILAVQKALSSAPPPLNFINASIVGATVALNTAKIASSKPPAFRTGGIVSGVPDGGADSVTANLSPREMVLTRAQQSTLFNRIQSGDLGGDSDSTLQAIKELTNAIIARPVQVMIDGRQVALSVRDQVRSGMTLA